jgi:hypothetical protein
LYKKNPKGNDEINGMYNGSPIEDDIPKDGKGF